MATLHVRNVPDKLYRKIQQLADTENRSLTAEVIQLLSQALHAHEARRSAAAVVDDIRVRANAVELRRDWMPQH